MKKSILFTLILCSLMSFSTNVKAQTLKDLLNSAVVKNAVTTVTGGQTLSVQSLNGRWTYTKPAVQLESDNTLKDLAGSVATTEMEKKLKDYCTKAGIIEGVFNYQFNTDSTFTCLLKGRTLSGTYSLNPTAKTIELVYGSLGKGKLNTFTAATTLSGNELTLLFDADKLLKFISTVSAMSSSTSLKTLSSLSKEYKGMNIGFHLTK